MMDFAEEMAPALHSAHSCRGMQDHCSLWCLNKGFFSSLFVQYFVKAVNYPITVTCTNSPSHSSVLASAFFFPSASWRQYKVNCPFHKPDTSLVKKFRFIQISCHLTNSVFICCTLANFVTKASLRECIEQETPGAGNSEDATFLFASANFFERFWSGH